MDLCQRPRRCIGLERVNRRAVGCGQRANALATSRPSLSSSLTVPSCIDSSRKSIKARTSCCFFWSAIVAGDGRCPIYSGANSQQQLCRLCGDASTTTTTTSATCFSAAFPVSHRRTLSSLQSRAMSMSAVSSSNTSTTTAPTPSPGKSSRSLTFSRSKPVRIRP